MTTDVTPMRIGTERVTAEVDSIVSSPYDGHEVGRVPVGKEEHLAAAVAAAKARHAEGPLPAWQRAEILDRAAVLLADRHEEFARSISEESAKAIKTARVEAARAVDTFRFSAAVARSLTGETIPLDASSAGVGKVGFVLRVPIGVVAAISPFNFPLNLVAHKVAPSIAVGCPMVLKPASATPLTALRLASLLIDEAGLPPGWLNVVTCSGSVADALVESDDVAMITFTGSPPVGWSIRAKAPRKRVNLELGNNSPGIIDEGSDWETAATKIATAGYSFAGQSCISVQRVFVHESISDAFINALTTAVSGLVVGDPADDATDVSALITPADTVRVGEWVDRAVDDGAEIEIGGSVDDDGVLGPIVLSGVRPEMEVCRNEVFGPVVGVQSFEDFDEALRLANDSRYGLQAGVFTRDLGRAMQAARVLEYGGITINEVPTWRADQMPYGGIRDSGNTREGPAYAAREMTEERLIVVQG